MVGATQLAFFSALLRYSSAYVAATTWLSGFLQKQAHTHEAVQYDHLLFAGRQCCIVKSVSKSLTYRLWGRVLVEVTVSSRVFGPASNSAQVSHHCIAAVSLGSCHHLVVGVPAGASTQECRIACCCIAC
jgi:hypothetical protein